MGSGYARLTPLLLTLAFGLLSGCGYTLQTKHALPFGAVSIGVIENRTFEPKLQDRLHRSLADALMEYGFEVTASSPQVLSGTVTSFVLLPVAERDLTTTVYQIIVTCSFTLMDAEGGKPRTLAEVTSPFMTIFNAGGRIENVIAQKELATEFALRDLSRELVRRLIYAPAK